MKRVQISHFTVLIFLPSEELNIGHVLEIFW